MKGWTWGEQLASPETPEVWDAWTFDLSTETARISGSWGKLNILDGENFVSPVMDFGSVEDRVLYIEIDKYNIGRGSGLIQWRGDYTTFFQDADEVTGPVWEPYPVGGDSKPWRYIQIRVLG